MDLTTSTTSTTTGRDYATSFTVAQTPQQVYAAVLDVRAWWTGEIDGRTDAVGEQFDYRHPPQHVSRQRVDELVPDRYVVWRVTDSALAGLSDPAEWTGSEIVFTIEPAPGGATLHFTHIGLVPDVECYGACSAGWRHYVGGSLHSLITTGAGLPDPWMTPVRDRAEGTDREFGSIERELTIEATPEVVYEVISSPRHLREWWPDDVEVDETGTVSAVLFGDPASGEAKRERITVVEAAPPRRFAFRWVDDGSPARAGTSLLVTFELEPVADGTRLRFTESGFRERGWEAAVLEETYRDHSAGWDHFLGRLGTYCAGVIGSAAGAGPVART